MHRAKELVIGIAMGQFGRWTRPALVMRNQGVPFDDDQADGNEKSDEPQASQLEENQEVKPPPDFARKAEPRRGTQAALVSHVRRLRDFLNAVVTIERHVRLSNLVPAT